MSLSKKTGKPRGSYTRVYHKYPFADLAKGILEQGIRDRDYFEGYEDWLCELCGLAGLHPDNYYHVMEFFYGPRRVNEDQSNERDYFRRRAPLIKL
jgi:hypothetical protein